MIPVHGAVAGLQVDLQDCLMMIWNAEIYIYIKDVAFRRIQ